MTVDDIGNAGLDGYGFADALGRAVEKAREIDQKGGKDLRVKSPFEREAERLRLAKYFREKGLI